MENLSHQELGELFLLAKSGDAQAFERLYEATARYQYYQIQLFTSNKEEADDILQEVYLSFFQAMPRIDQPSAVIAYLNRITYRTCIGHLRKNKRKKLTIELDENILIDNGLVSEDTAVQTVINRENAGELKDALKSLTHKERMIIIMRFGEKASIKEIVKALGISKNTVYRTMDRALKKLEVSITCLAVPSSAVTGVLERLINEAAKTVCLPPVPEPSCIPAPRQSKGSAERLLLGMTAVAAAVVLGFGFSPVHIDSIKLSPDGYASEKQLSFRVSCALPVRQVTVTAPDGKTLTPDNTGGSYTVPVKANGTYHIKAGSGGIREKVHSLKVTDIDSMPPQFVSKEFIDGKLKLTFQDEGSGVDPEQVYCIDDRNGLIKPVFVQDGVYVFHLSPGRYEIHAADLLGNEQKGSASIDTR